MLTANGYVMGDLAQDSALCTRMGQVSAGKIQGHTPEKWVEDFEQIVLSMLRNNQENEA